MEKSAIMHAPQPKMKQKIIKISFTTLNVPMYRIQKHHKLILMKICKETFVLKWAEITLRINSELVINFNFAVSMGFIYIL